MEVIDWNTLSKKDKKLLQKKLGDQYPGYNKKIIKSSGYAKHESALPSKTSLEPLDEQKDSLFHNISVSDSEMNNLKKISFPIENTKSSTDRKNLFKGTLVQVLSSAIPNNHQINELNIRSFSDIIDRKSLKFTNKDLNFESLSLKNSDESSLDDKDNDIIVPLNYTDEELIEHQLLSKHIYEQSDKAKDRNKRYEQSEKGKKAKAEQRRRYYLKHKK